MHVDLSDFRRATLHDRPKKLDRWAVMSQHRTNDIRLWECPPTWGGNLFSDERANFILAGAFLARVSYGGASNGFPKDDDDSLNYDFDYQGYLDRFGSIGSKANWHLLSNTELDRHFPDWSQSNVGILGRIGFTDKGLYRASTGFFDNVKNETEALVADTTIDGERTLVLSFRGSDGNDAAFQQQTFGLWNSDPDGVRKYYDALRPLIFAVYDYIRQENGDIDLTNNISKVVVSGHSLGGTMADVFTLVDAFMFDELKDVDLTVVSIASAGIDPNLPAALKKTKGALSDYAKKKTDFAHLDATEDSITGLITPAYYYQIAHLDDRVRYPEVLDETDLLTELRMSHLHPLVVEAALDHYLNGDLAFNDTLIQNIHFEKTLEVGAPNITNTDVLYNRFIDNPGFGALHNDQLYWANIQGLFADPLNGLYTNQTIQVGLTDYTRVPDTPPGSIASTNPINIFKDYISYKVTFQPGQDFDQGENRLIGTGTADYILGLTGNDSIAGHGGNDLLSGGDGIDTLSGGAGDDTLHGGAGLDTAVYDQDWQSFALSGPLDPDNFVLSSAASGIDTLISIAQVTFGNGTFSPTELFALLEPAQPNPPVTPDPGNSAPEVVATPTIELGTGDTIGADQFVLVSDPDGIADIDYVRFWDSTPGTDGGYFTLDGGRISGGYVDVDASELDRIAYQAGASLGSNLTVVEAVDLAGAVSGDVYVDFQVVGDPAPMPPPPAVDYGSEITRVSVATDDTQGDGYSFGPSVSADGRFVTFISDADHLVSGDTNGEYDVFVHDRVTGETSRLSVAKDGTQANGRSYDPSISADGRFVSFISHADNLVAGDTNGAWDTFVHDRVTSETSRLSMATDGTQANGYSYDTSISADGRFVTFLSEANNLVTGDTNGATDIFLHDRVSGETSRISLATDGTQANGPSYLSSISADGRFVTFESGANNLVAGDTNGALDIFVHDRVTGETSHLSVAKDGTQANGHSYRPSISADGRYVTFGSEADNLVAGDTNGATDIFLHDRVSGETSRLSVAKDGTQANGRSYDPSISADGRFVTFLSEANNLVTGDTNGATDIFVHDRVTGETSRLSVAKDGAQANGHSYYPSISADGRFVTFGSDADNLVSGDINRARDDFVVGNPLHPDFVSPNFAPLVDGLLDLSSGPGETLGADSFITISDPDGMADIDFVRFWDSTPGTDGGTLTLDGVPISGNYVDVAAADLDRVAYQSGPNVGTNQIAVEAVDRSGAYSNEFLVTVDVTAPAPATPVINTVSGDDRITPVEAALSVVITGQADPGASIAVLFWTGLETATAGADGTWSVSIAPEDLPEAGTYDVFVSAANGSGALSEVARRTVTVDATDDVPLNETGTEGPDVFVGSSLDDSFDGLGGNDSASGAAGNDFLSGGPGNDTLRGEDGLDTLRGGDGDDLLDASGGSASTQSWGDLIVPGLGADRIIGHAALWAADNGIEIVYGNLPSVGGLTIVSGANGSGTVTSADLRVADTFTFADYFEGSMEADTITGSDDDHWEGFAGRAGNDVIDGRGGVSQVSYSSDHYYTGSSRGILANLATGVVTDTFGDTDRLINIDQVWGSVFGDSIDARGSATRWLVRGDAGSDLIYGSSLNDDLRGGADNDMIAGGRGADSLNGDEGSDILIGGERGLYRIDQSAQVLRLYDSAFGRNPDVNGHQNWVVKLLSGMSLTQITASFIASNEFKSTYGATTNAQFVTLLYNNVLGRNPSVVDRDFWVGRLESNWTRADVVTFFSEGREHVGNTEAALKAFEDTHDITTWADDIYRVFKAILDRDPDGGGYIHWTEKLASGSMTLPDVISSFMESPEFTSTFGQTTVPQFITLLYQNVMDRTPSQGEVDYWTGKIDGNWTRANVVNFFVGSEEFKTKTDAGFTTFIMAHGPDDVLDPGSGDSVLSGGLWSDTFVFSSDAQASTVAVTDVEAWDTLDFSGFGLSQQQVLDALAQDGEDVIFASGVETIIFADTKLSDITQDMILV